MSSCTQSSRKKSASDPPATCVEERVERDDDHAQPFEIGVAEGEALATQEQQKAVDRTAEGTSPPQVGQGSGELFIERGASGGRRRRYSSARSR
jgi:hypothetical protein